MLIAVLASTILLIFLFQPNSPAAKEGSLCLKIVRRQAQPQPVVFFRVEGTGGKRTELYLALALVIKGEAPGYQVTNFLDCSSYVWHGLPLQDPRKDFGVFAPSNCTAWNFKVFVKVTESAFERFNSTCKSFKGTLDTGGDFGTAFRCALGNPHFGYTTLTSEVITNSITTDSEF